MSAISVNEHAAKVVFSPMNTGANAYVYAIVVDGVVRYIGKGTGRRTGEHRNIVERLLRDVAGGPKEQVVHRRIAAAVRSGLAWSIVKTHVGLTEQRALDLEIDLIAKAPDGQLWNIAEGGRGCTSEFARRRWSNHEYRAKQEAAIKSPETLRRKSEASRESQNQPDVRERVKSAQRAAFARPESKARLVARTLRFWQSDEYRAKVVAGRKAQWTPEARAKQSAKHKAMWTDEYRAKRSAAHKAMFLDPEFKAQWMEKRAATRARNRSVC